mmetsp:Transcript_35155/g.75916  ORF Transcript_35155/g.75916 Transcript_35155/m.75916 type:complete len:129 (-) Transcript_35155:269-655(-)
MGACSFWRNCCCLAASKDDDTEDKHETADQATDKTEVEDSPDEDFQPEKKPDDVKPSFTFGGDGARKTYKNFMQSETTITISEGVYDVSQTDIGLLEDLIPDAEMLDEKWTDSDSNSDASLTTKLIRG